MSGARGGRRSAANYLFAGSDSRHSLTKVGARNMMHTWPHAFPSSSSSDPHPAILQQAVTGTEQSDSVEGNERGEGVGSPLLHAPARHVDEQGSAGQRAWGL